MSHAFNTQFDIIIAGGGLIGSSLTLALAPCDLNILMVEKYSPDHQQQPSFDERTVALTWSSRQIFKGIGVWDQIASDEATPIIDIHVSRQGESGAAHLHRRHVNTEALGYVVPTRVVGQVLYTQLKEYNNISVACPDEVIDHQNHDNYITVQLGQSQQEVSARLLIIADGGRSQLLQDVDLGRKETPYPQNAILSIIESDRPHRGRAYERFTSEGPVALLPYQKHRYAAVWTTSQQNIDSRMALTDSEFGENLQAQFGDRAGRLSNPTPRKSYPLKKSVLSQPHFGRGLVVGNAAHTVHPVAGQGFNLGLRNLADLAELIALRSSRGDDIGESSVLEKFVEDHRRRVDRVQHFTHSMISVFSSEHLAMKLLRGKGLHMVELCPSLKRRLLERTMGLSGKQSRLARGLSLAQQ